jgi:hypothetical protein
LLKRLNRREAGRARKHGTGSLFTFVLLGLQEPLKELLKTHGIASCLIGDMS